MADTEKILEFDQIKEKLAELAYTEEARKQIYSLAPYMYESELRAKMRETSEARKLLEKAGNPPLTSLGETEEFMRTAEQGGCLTAAQLEEVVAVLSAMRRLKDYLERCKQYEVGLSYYEEGLDSLEYLKEEIRLKIRNEQVADSASGELRSVRSKILQAESRMREKAEAAIRANKQYLSDSFATSRNGHICIPVKKEYRAKVKGVVIDQSSTGNTLFIEPAAAGKYYDELQLLRIDEEQEVKRILYTLTAMIAEESETMAANRKTIEKLDFIFAKGKLSAEYGGREPEINTERRIVLTDARHPLMDPDINIPLQFRIGGSVKGVVITGPNMGGKTVAIKTVALNCMMAQCGLHVACGAADICMNNAFLCDIGDGQNLSENLSTFSAHIKNVLEILRRADGESLVVMDELGSGTDPTEGMGIAIAILAELKKSGALYLVTTHYPEVKRYAEKEEGVVNARMTFDKESLKPLYRLVIGEAGESCAFYIAQRLGMPEPMLKRAAAEAYGNETSKGLRFSGQEEEWKRKPCGRIRKKKEPSNRQTEALKFHLGDSVMVYPDKRIGIVCRTADEKGNMRVQMPGGKIWVNHTRVRLQVAAAELYPENYDFSILFDTVENRKLRHQMERKHVAGAVLEAEPGEEKTYK